jgi:hypothetical protein
MTVYSRWRSHEKDFRELQQQHPELYAHEPCVSGEWLVRGDGHERFESMAGIAAMDAGHAIGDRHRWLDLVKTFLLDRGSEQITCIQVGSASGVGNRGDRLDPDGPAVRGWVLCTIRPVCQASADYCLERAKLARRDELTPIEDLSPTPEAAPEQSPISRTISVGAQAELRFPKRSEWLRARLAERSWNRNDPLRHRGPDPKTIDRILAGKAVREDVLEKLANALSKKFTKVTVLDIPQD